MSVATILDPSTGKIAETYLPQTGTTFDDLTLTPPGLVSFQKVNPIQAEVLSLQPDFSTQQRLTFTNNASPPLGDIASMGTLYLIGEGSLSTANPVQLEGSGTSFTLTTSSGATPIQITADALSLSGLTTINGTPVSSAGILAPVAGSATYSSATIPTAQLWVLTLNTPYPVGTRFLATLNLNFSLNINPAVPAPGTQDPLISFNCVYQSGTHPTLPFPVSQGFGEPSVQIAYPDTSVATPTGYSLTNSTIIVSDGSPTYSFGVSVTSPANTYTFTSTLAYLSLLPVS